MHRNAIAGLELERIWDRAMLDDLSPTRSVLAHAGRVHCPRDALVLTLIVWMEGDYCVCAASILVGTHPHPLALGVDRYHHDAAPGWLGCCARVGSQRKRRGHCHHHRSKCARSSARFFPPPSPEKLWNLHVAGRIARLDSWGTPSGCWSTPRWYSTLSARCIHWGLGDPISSTATAARCERRPPALRTLWKRLLDEKTHDVGLPKVSPAYRTSASMLTIAKGLPEVFKRKSNPRPGFELRPHDTVIDIGGNIGIFLLRAAPQVPKGRLISVEPTPPPSNAECRTSAATGCATSALCLLLRRVRRGSCSSSITRDGRWRTAPPGRPPGSALAARSRGSRAGCAERGSITYPLLP